MITEQDIIDQNTRIADGISTVSNQIDALRYENRQLRDALFQFNYPPDPKVLREIADEIDCGPECCHSHTGWDTNAHVCSREDSPEGCAASKAWVLRQFADAIETKQALER